MSFRIFFIVIAISYLTCRCAHRSPVPGLLFSNVKWGKTDALTEQSDDSRTFTNCAISILGLFSFGDASLYLTRKNGHIDTGTYVDESYKNLFGVYQRYCLTAYGEKSVPRHPLREFGVDTQPPGTITKKRKIINL